MRAAYDDLFLSDKEANKRSAAQLKGWFKTKTGVGDAVAEKMASTFKTLADYADFDATPAIPATSEPSTPALPATTPPEVAPEETRKLPLVEGVSSLGLFYRLEIHLPDCQNIDTFRAIFKALRES